MDLIKQSRIRTSAMALTYCLIAALSDAAHALPVDTAEEEPRPGVSDEASQRCQWIVRQADRPDASPKTSLWKSCQALDRIPITEADADLILQKIIVQAGGDSLP